MNAMRSKILIPGIILADSNPAFDGKPIGLLVRSNDNHVVPSQTARTGAVRACLQADTASYGENRLIRRLNPGAAVVENYPHFFGRDPPKGCQFTQSGIRQHAIAVSVEQNLSDSHGKNTLRWRQFIYPIQKVSEGLTLVDDGYDRAGVWGNP